MPVIVKRPATAGPPDTELDGQKDRSQRAISVESSSVVSGRIGLASRRRLAEGNGKSALTGSASAR
jgi:hypothetical protein